jgi:hypothetical protein
MVYRDTMGHIEPNITAWGVLIFLAFAGGRNNTAFSASSHFNGVFTPCHIRTDEAYI